MSGGGSGTGGGGGGGLVRVALRKDLARSVRRGHPWIYADALRPQADGAHAPADGDVVLVTARDGRPLGRGYWTADAPIAVRMLETTDRHAEPPALVAARLKDALARRVEAIDLAETTAFRWVHGEGDLLPGLHLDLYGAYAAARFDGPGARAFYLGIDLPRLLREAIAAVPALPPLSLHAVIERGRGARGGAAERAAPLSGSLPDGDEIEVRENGLRFGVDLVRGQKGGLFLDQRENRARVRALAGGRRVLNLFGYTGGFSVYAAAGGAVHTTTVDVAAGAIAAARRNFARNAAATAASQTDLVVADAFDFLTAAATTAAPARWDLVVSDPPSFAPNRRALPEALRAYRRLHRLCASVVAPGGLLCAASCSSHVDEAAFLATVEAGCRDAGRTFTLRSRHGAATDHPVRAEFPEGRYLKLVVGDVGAARAR